jgi:hypothetical protein
MSGDFDELFQRRNGGWAERAGGARPTPQEPAADPAPVPEEGAYRAYGYTPTDDLETCDIAWWLAGDVPQGQEIQYRFLVRIGYLGDDQLHLMMTDCIIAIEGKNLHELRKRLARRKVTFIQAYNSQIWAERPVAKEPIIERIAILYPGEGAKLRDL